MSSFEGQNTRGITKEEFEKFRDFMTNKAPHAKCVSCGSVSHAEMQEGDFYVDLCESTVPNIGKGAPYAYLRKIAVICTNCSFITYFSAKHVGL